MKLPPAYETEIYIGETGYLVLKQINSFDEEVVVVLTRDQAGKANQAIANLLEVDGWEGGDDGETK